MAKYKDHATGIIRGVVGEILIKHLKKQVKQTQRKKKIRPVVQKKPARPRGAKNPFKAFRQLARSRFGSLVLHWYFTLTDEERQAWEDYAKKHPQKDQLDEWYTLTGYQMFLKKNITAHLLGIPFMATPPPDEHVEPLQSFSASLDSSTRSVIISFSPSPLPGNHRLVVMGTGWINAKRENWISLARKIYLSPAGAESPIDISTRYIKRWGIFPANSYHAFRAYLINEENFAESNFIDIKVKSS